MPYLDRRLLDHPLSPARLNEAIDRLAARTPGPTRSLAWRSRHDRPVEVLTLGGGSPTVVYVGGDAASAALLMRFVDEYCVQLGRQGRLFGVSLPYLATLRRLLVLPMPDPDAIAGDAVGCRLASDGGASLSRMQGSEERLADWLGSLEPALVLLLREGTPGVTAPRGDDRRICALARSFGRLTGSPVSVASTMPAHGGFVLGAGCGTVFCRYAALRELLFLAPTLIGK